MAQGELSLDELILLFVFLLAGFILRQLIKPLQKLYLLAGLIGGALALILGLQVLGLFQTPENWGSMASPMINIVLTTTLFGTTINVGKLKSYAGAISANVLSYFSQLIVMTIPFRYAPRHQREIKHPLTGAATIC